MNKPERGQYDLIWESHVGNFNHIIEYVVALMLSSSCCTADKDIVVEISRDAYVPGSGSQGRALSRMDGLMLCKGCVESLCISIKDYYIP
jgi:hypothetical protein